MRLPHPKSRPYIFERHVSQAAFPLQFFPIAFQNRFLKSVQYRASPQGKRSWQEEKIFVALHLAAGCLATRETSA